MNEATHADIIRRVEKIEIDVAVLDSKSNRLHQDVKDTQGLIGQLRKENMETMETIRRENQDTQHIARKTQTLVIAVPGIIAAILAFIQIVEMMAHK